MLYFRFVAVHDSRTTPTCRAHDGEVFPVEDASPGANVPPLHPRCRSTIVASIDDGGSGIRGRRIARDKEGKNIRIPADMRYADWKAVYIDKSKSWAAWKQESGYKGREMFERAVNNNGIDVMKEYSDKAKPGQGIISQQAGFRAGRHVKEVAAVNTLHAMYGGDFILLEESLTPDAKTPDFMWNNKAWELKTLSITTENAVGKAIRKGQKQIITEDGGLVLDFCTIDFDIDKILEAAAERMRRSIKRNTDIIFMYNGRIVTIRRYLKQ